MGIRIAVYEGTRSLRMLRKEQLSGLLVGVMPTSTLLHRDSSAGKQELTQRCPVVPDLSRKAPFVRGRSAKPFRNDMKDSRASARRTAQYSLHAAVLSLRQWFHCTKYAAAIPSQGKRSASPGPSPPATAVLDRGSRPRSGLNPAATLRDTL